MKNRRPTKCEGCSARAEALRFTSGGYLCPACNQIFREDERPAPPPSRKDIPPESRMRHHPSGSGPTFIRALFVDRGRRAQYG